ncbi:MAG: 5'/3'-nucleotidase SurE [Lewinellaceae bacterium]|nr:5'/3'-nucleotidase SurE [Saprospiraceae bacterium]MCB9340298.1 5'/3'-nucleotidase SurE [Lewinellaceae bacterium]
MKTRPLILVTNDDGIAAPGMKALVEVAKTLGEVVVVAPDSPQSGQGHAITINAILRLKKVDIFKDIEAYECSGTPVDCVKLAKHKVLHDRQVDLCVSGVNHGSNASINILYSGTMSAAMEASLEGIKSIGFSLLDYSWDADFDSCKPFLKELMVFVLEHGMEHCKLLNVNIPKLKTEELKGFRICRQAEARWIERYVESIDPRGQKYYWLTGEFTNDDKGDDTDVWALENGYISVVPSGHDLTRYEAIESFKALESEVAV